MASVTGVTAERAQEIWDASVVSGHVSDTGQLILTTRGGATLDAGSVAVPTTLKAYPVGSIFFTVTNSNPNTQLGLSGMTTPPTWVPWGVGRVPVGVDTSQTEFDGVEETGGSKTHRHGPGTLLAALFVGYWKAKFGATFGATNVNNFSTTGASGASGNQGVSVEGETSDASSLMPYVTCYMWKRTA